MVFVVFGERVREEGEIKEREERTRRTDRNGCRWNGKNWPERLSTPRRMLIVRFPPPPGRIRRSSGAKEHHSLPSPLVLLLHLKRKSRAIR